MRALALCLLLLLPRLGEAALQFSQPPVGGQPAYYADRHEVQPGPPIADDFAFSTYPSLAQVTWWGVYLGPVLPVDDFLVEFYEGPIASHPLPFHSFSTSAVRPPTALLEESGLTIYQYSFDLPVTSLVVGVALALLAVTQLARRALIA